MYALAARLQRRIVVAEHAASAGMGYHMQLHLYVPGDWRAPYEMTKEEAALMLRKGNALWLSWHCSGSFTCLLRPADATRARPEALPAAAALAMPDLPGSE